MFYGWIVTFTGFLVSVVGIGARYSFGVFLKSLEIEFNMTRAATSGIFAIYMMLCVVVAILGGWGLDRFGPRKLGVFIGIFTSLSFLTTSLVTSAWQLLITFSLLLALGTGALYGAVNTTVSRWFREKRGLAVGFSSSGGGVGVIVISPIASYLISSFDWRTAYFVLGTLFGGIIIIASLFLRKDPSEMGLLPDGITAENQIETPKKSRIKFSNNELTLKQALKTFQFWQLGLVWLFISLGLHLVMVHVVPYATGEGISALEAAFIMSVIGFTNIVGRLVLGKLSDIFGRQILSAICALIQFSALFLLMWANATWMIYVFAVVFGMMWGGNGSIITALVGDIFGTFSLGIIMGIISAMWAVGAAIGPTLGGYLFDISGNYFTAFGFGAAGFLIAAALVAMLKPLPEMSDNAMAQQES